MGVCFLFQLKTGKNKMSSETVEGYAGGQHRGTVKQIGRVCALKAWLPTQLCPQKRDVCRLLQCFKLDP